MTMNKYGVWRVLKIAVIVTVAINLFGFAIMQLWNWLMPAIFGLKVITFVQALGLLLLSKILFGGFHRHGGGRGWKRGQWEARWAAMTEEEREKFRTGMKGRRGCGFGRYSEPSAPQSVT
jgi:hypothetical protein